MTTPDRQGGAMQHSCSYLSDLAPACLLPAAHSELRFDDERAKRHTKVPATAPAGERQRDIALGHYLRLGRTILGASFGFGGGVMAKHLMNVMDAAEAAVAVVDPALAEGQSTTLGAQLYVHALTVAAVDHAAAAVRLVEDRPAG